MEITECTSDFSSIKPRSGLQKHPLTLEVVEQLQEKKTTYKVNQLFRAEVWPLLSYMRVQYECIVYEPRLHWHSLAQNIVCLWFGKSSAAPPGMDAWYFSLIHSFLPWYAFAEKHIKCDCYYTAIVAKCFHICLNTALGLLYLFLFQNYFLLQHLHSIVLFIFLVPCKQNLWNRMPLAFSLGNMT